MTASPPGSPPAPSPVFLVMSLGRRWRGFVDAELQARGLSLRHVSALGHLAGDPGASYSELARRAAVTAQSMQATLRALEALGAVDRRSPAGRGRRAELHVTAVGAELVAWAGEVVARADAEFLAGIRDDLHDPLVEALLAAFLVER